MPKNFGLAVDINYLFVKYLLQRFVEFVRILLVQGLADGGVSVAARHGAGERAQEVRHHPFRGSQTGPFYIASSD